MGKSSSDIVRLRIGASPRKAGKPILSIFWMIAGTLVPMGSIASGDDQINDPRTRHEATQIFTFRTNVQDFCKKYVNFSSDIRDEKIMELSQQIIPYRFSSKIPGRRITPLQIENPDYLKMLQLIETEPLYREPITNRPMSLHEKCPDAMEALAEQLVVDYEKIFRKREIAPEDFLTEVLDTAAPEMTGFLVGAGIAHGWDRLHPLPEMNEKALDKELRNLLRQRKALVRGLPWAGALLLKAGKTYSDIKTDDRIWYPHPLVVLRLGSLEGKSNADYVLSRIGVDAAEFAAFAGFTEASIWVLEALFPKKFAGKGASSKVGTNLLGGLIGGLAMRYIGRPALEELSNQFLEVRPARDRLQLETKSFMAALQKSDPSSVAFSLQVSRLIEACQQYYMALYAPTAVGFMNVEASKEEATRRILRDLLHTEWALRGGDMEQYPDVDLTLEYLRLGHFLGKAHFREILHQGDLVQGYEPSTWKPMELPYNDWLKRPAIEVQSWIYNESGEKKERFHQGGKKGKRRKNEFVWDEVHSPTTIRRDIRPQDAKWRDVEFDRNSWKDRWALIDYRPDRWRADYLHFYDLPLDETDDWSVEQWIELYADLQRRNYESFIEASHAPDEEDAMRTFYGQALGREYRLQKAMLALMARVDWIDLNLHSLALLNLREYREKVGTVTGWVVEIGAGWREYIQDPDHYTQTRSRLATQYRNEIGLEDLEKLELPEGISLEEKIFMEWFTRKRFDTGLDRMKRGIVTQTPHDFLLQEIGFWSSLIEDRGWNEMLKNGAATLEFEYPGLEKIQERLLQLRGKLGAIEHRALEAEAIYDTLYRN